MRLQPWTGLRRREQLSQQVDSWLRLGQYKHSWEGVCGESDSSDCSLSLSRSAAVITQWQKVRGISVYSSHLQSQKLTGVDSCRVKRPLSSSSRHVDICQDEGIFENIRLPLSRKSIWSSLQYLAQIESHETTKAWSILSRKTSKNNSSPELKSGSVNPVWGVWALLILSFS